MLKIAVIGSHWFIKKFQQSITENRRLMFLYFAYDSYTEAPNIVKQLPAVDVVIFAGSFPYELSQQVIEDNQLPALYIRQDVNSLSLSLMKALLKGYTLQQISIDYRHQEEWDTLTRELDGNVPTMAFPISNTMTPDEVIQLHKENIVAYDAKIIITSVHQAATALLTEGVTTQRAVDSESSIIKMVDDAIQLATLHQLSDTQMAVGMFSADSLTTQEVTQFAHQLDAVFKHEDKLIKMYTTVGKLRRFLFSDLLQKWLDNLPIEFAIGFGSGETLLKAEQHAKMAYAYKLKEQKYQKACYYVDLHQRLTGPYPEQHSRLDLAVTNDYVYELTQQTNLSPMSISKIMQFEQLNKNLPFTIDDLAAYLQVTRRTAERIVKKLIATPYLHQVGEQTSTGKGRPKSIYQFSIK